MRVTLVVIYPRQKDIHAFETVYNGDHMPVAIEKLGGKTKIVASSVLGSPNGEPAFHGIAEIHLLSMQRPGSLCSMDGGKQTRLNHSNVRNCPGRASDRSPLGKRKRRTFAS